MSAATVPGLEQVGLGTLNLAVAIINRLAKGPGYIGDLCTACSGASDEQVRRVVHLMRNGGIPVTATYDGIYQLARTDVALGRYIGDRLVDYRTRGLTLERLLARHGEHLPAVSDALEQARQRVRRANRATEVAAGNLEGWLTSQPNGTGAAV